MLYMLFQRLNVSRDGYFCEVSFVENENPVEYIVFL